MRAWIIGSVLLAATILAGSLVPAGAARRPAEDVQRFFNGKDFSGWTFFLADSTAAKSGRRLEHRLEGGGPDLQGRPRRLRPHRKGLRQLPPDAGMAVEPRHQAGRQQRRAAPDRRPDKVWPKSVEAQPADWPGGRYLADSRRPPGHPAGPGGRQRSPPPAAHEVERKAGGRVERVRIRCDRDRIPSRSRRRGAERGNPRRSGPGKMRAPDRGRTESTSGTSGSRPCRASDEHGTEPLRRALPPPPDGARPSGGRPRRSLPAARTGAAAAAAARPEPGGPGAGRHAGTRSTTPSASGATRA